MKLITILLAILFAGSVEAQTMHTFNLQWQDNADNEQGFFVYRDNVNVATLPANSVAHADTVTGVENQEFCYQVSAWNHEFSDGSGNIQESARSNMACGTIPVSGGPIFPEAPVNLVAQCNADGTQAVLSWSSVLNADNYALRVNHILNDNYAGCAYGWLCSTPPDYEVNAVGGLSYTVGVIPDEPYNWWVHGLQGGSWGDAGGSSFTCNGPPPVGDTQPPEVTIVSPLNLATVQRKSNVNIQLAFSDNVGVVETRFLVNDSLLLNCGTLVSSCTWTVPGAPHRTYTIRAEVRDAAGNMAFHQITVRTP